MFIQYLHIFKYVEGLMMFKNSFRWYLKLFQNKEIRSVKPLFSQLMFFVFKSQNGSEFKAHKNRMTPILVV